MDILKNRINIFSVETSFCQFSNMASSGQPNIWHNICHYEKDKCYFGKHFLIHIFVYIILQDKHFFKPEEAMFENWQKLVSTEKVFILFLRISILHEIKQNEKYPYAY